MHATATGALAGKGSPPGYNSKHTPDSGVHAAATDAMAARRSPPEYYSKDTPDSGVRAAAPGVMAAKGSPPEYNSKHTPVSGVLAAAIDAMAAKRSPPEYNSKDTPDSGVRAAAPGVMAAKGSPPEYNSKHTPVSGVLAAAIDAMAAKGSPPEYISKHTPDSGVRAAAKGAKAGKGSPPKYNSKHTPDSGVHAAATDAMAAKGSPPEYNSKHTPDSSVHAAATDAMAAKGSPPESNSKHTPVSGVLAAAIDAMAGKGSPSEYISKHTPDSGIHAAATDATAAKGSPPESNSKHTPESGVHATATDAMAAKGSPPESNSKHTPVSGVLAAAIDALAGKGSPPGYNSKHTPDSGVHAAATDAMAAKRSPPEYNSKDTPDSGVRAAATDVMAAKGSPPEYNSKDTPDSGVRAAAQGVMAAKGSPPEYNSKHTPVSGVLAAAIDAMAGKGSPPKYNSKHTPDSGVHAAATDAMAAKGSPPEFNSKYTPDSSVHAAATDAMAAKGSPPESNSKHTPVSGVLAAATDAMAAKGSPPEYISKHTPDSGIHAAATCAMAAKGSPPEYNSKHIPDSGVHAAATDAMATQGMTALKDATGDEIIKQSVAQRKCMLCTHAREVSKQKLTNHIKNVHLKHFVDFEGKKAFACKLSCLGESATHYHCPHCVKIFKKRYLCVAHIHTLQIKLAKHMEKSKKLHKSKKIQCSECDTWHEPRHMKQHMRRKHVNLQSIISASRHHNGILIDEENGIYMISKSLKGNPYPLHVQKKVSAGDQSFRCESKVCMDGCKMAARSKMATKSCCHLQSSNFINITSKKEILHEDVLFKLVSMKRIDQKRINDLSEKNNEAKASNEVAVAIYSPTGEEGHMYYLSVYTGVREFFSPMGRTIISVNTKRDKWTCACEKHKLRKGCTHKAMAKWFLAEYHPDRLFTYSEDKGEEIVVIADDSEDRATVSEPENTGLPLSVKMSMVDVIYENNRIPVEINQTILDIDNKEIEDIVPPQNYCPSCGKKFEERSLRLMTKAGMLVCIRFLKRNINVYEKHCEVCMLITRHQDYNSNIVNVNGQVFLSLNLCLWLRFSLQRAVSPHATFRTLEDIHKQNLPLHILRLGYVLFEALTIYSDDMLSQNCLLCGIHPACQIFDGNHKICFNLCEDQLHNGSQPENVHGHQSDENAVDIEEFWSKLEKSIIFKAITNFSDDNPYQVRQSFTGIAPWIAPRSRKGRSAVNTEAMKLQGTGMEAADLASLQANENLTEDMVNYLKAIGRKSACIELAEDCGLSHTGKSMAAIISMLEHHIRSGNPCNKLYEKFSKKSGGIVMGMCPHMIVHCTKFLLTYESVRDICDLQKSLEVLPNVTIYDKPRALVEHIKRRDKGAFDGNDGRLCEESAENIAAAKAGQLMIDMKFLETGEYQPVQEATDHDYAIRRPSQQDPHPLTGVRKRYVLYDRLHERNSSSESDRYLRSVKAVPQLKGIVDTEAAEHSNAFLGKMRYFLDLMGHEHHFIITRSLIMFRNRTINKKSRQNMEKFVQDNIDGVNVRLQVGPYGRLIIKPLQTSNMIPSHKAGITTTNGSHGATVSDTQAGEGALEAAHDTTQTSGLHVHQGVTQGREMSSANPTSMSAGLIAAIGTQKVTPQRAPLESMSACDIRVGKTESPQHTMTTVGAKSVTMSANDFQVATVSYTQATSAREPTLEGIEADDQESVTLVSEYTANGKVPFMEMKEDPRKRKIEGNIPFSKKSGEVSTTDRLCKRQRGTEEEGRGRNEGAPKFDLSRIKKEKTEKESLNFLVNELEKVQKTCMINEKNIYGRHYVASICMLRLTPYDPDLWTNNNLSRDTLISMLKQNGNTVTPVASPFNLTMDNMNRLLSDEEWLDGETIDACLLVITAFVSSRQTFIVMPNQFLSSKSDIGGWIPHCVLVNQCAGLVMAAHHPNHWCLAAININEGLVFYADSCPGACDKAIKKQHLAKLRYLCSAIDMKQDWKYFDDNDRVASYLHIPNLPLQPTLVDCGLFVVTYWWMILCRFIEGETWTYSPSVDIHISEILPLRYLLGSLLVHFSGHDVVQQTAERSDTGKWFGLKLFPLEKKCKRVSTVLLSKSSISEADRRRFLNTYFPHAQTLLTYIQEKQLKEIGIPECVYIDDEGFTKFVQKVLNTNEDDSEWRDMVAFTCYGEKGYNTIDRVMQTLKLSVSYVIR